MSTKKSPYNSQDAFAVDMGDGEYGLDRYDISSKLSFSGVKHTVLEGETLQSISFKYYGSSGRWGDIATFNGIVDPFDIEKGVVLAIPN